MSNPEQVPARSNASEAQVRNSFPPGLIGDVAAYFYSQSPYPNETIALAGAIGFLAGICGRRYNTYTGVGLNQYIGILAHTGRGKEAVAEGSSRLLDAVKGKIEAGEKGLPSITSFKGPGHIASAEALLKHLNRNPCFFSIIGEFGIWLKTVTAPNASSTLVGIKRATLDLYSKTGDGKVLDPMVYSDTTKNTDPVPSPAFTFIGESTFHEFFEGIDEGAIINGLATRFMLFCTEAARPYLNPNVGMSPSAELVERVADLAACCLTYSPTRGAVRVPLDDEASQTFKQYERQTTDHLNANQSTVHSELWNRAFLKGLKLASLVAVGVNPHAPVVTKELAEQSIALVSGQINYLTAKFTNGEVGEEAGNETKQQEEVMLAIIRFIKKPYEYTGFSGWIETHRDGIVTDAYIKQRVRGLACFRKDKRGATRVTELAIMSLLSSDVLVEIPAKQMAEQYGGRKPKAYAISNPYPFENILKKRGL